MLTPADFHPYQRRAIQHALQHPRSAIWLFMSAGKTVIGLTAFLARLMRLQVKRALVVAPLLVAELTWRQEAAKWSHLTGLRMSLLRGNASWRLRELHRPDVDIHIINYEQLPWLTKTVWQHYIRRGKRPPWDMLVLDEVDRFKDSQGKRLAEFETLLVPPGSRAKHQFAPDPDAETYFPYRMGLTGTPASNGLLDLHGQFRVLDGGKRLYWFIGDFRSMFCSPSAGPREYTKWEVRSPAAKAEILRRVGDMTLSLNEEECITLPEYLFHDHWVDLPPAVFAAYQKFEKTMFTEMDRHEDDPRDGEWDLEATSRPSARMKCRQLANGAVKMEDQYTLAHNAKLEVLDQIVHEAQGKPILLSYVFRADMERIRDRYKKSLKVAYIGPGTKDAEAIVDAWNRQEYHMLISHPASVGHGLNLQGGGNEIVWFGPTDNPRWWHQLNARLRRQGQKAESVHIRRILARNTVDEPIVEGLDSKLVDETTFRRTLEAYKARKQHE